MKAHIKEEGQNLLTGLWQIVTGQVYKYALSSFSEAANDLRQMDGLFVRQVVTVCDGSCVLNNSQSSFP